MSILAFAAAGLLGRALLAITITAAGPLGRALLAITIAAAGPLGRALLATAIIAAGIALFWLLNRLILYRAQKNGAPQAAQGLFTLPGVPAILYFTTPECVACKTIQRPALERLQQRLGGRLQVVEVNAQERPDLASRWGVLSVPTTFIIDERGQLRHVNHGATRAEKLLQQLESASSSRT